MYIILSAFNLIKCGFYNPHFLNYNTSKWNKPWWRNRGWRFTYLRDLWSIMPITIIRCSIRIVRSILIFFRCAVRNRIVFITSLAIVLRSSIARINASILIFFRLIVGWIVVFRSWWINRISSLTVLTGVMIWSWLWKSVLRSVLCANNFCWACKWIKIIPSTVIRLFGVALYAADKELVPLLDVGRSESW